MINTKTNTIPKYIFLLVILLGLYNCKDRELFTFEKNSLTTDMLSDCRNEDCALLEINLLKIIDDNQVAQSINKEIERVACDILNTSEYESALTIDKAITQFNTSYQSILEEFPDETIPYEANIDCKLAFQCKDLISVAIDSYMFTGGAHGYGGVSYINIDTETGKRLPNKMLFENSDKFTDYIEKIFRAQNKIPSNESINSTGFFFEDDVFSLPKNIGFTDKEVVLHYNQYEISSYADGPIELRIKKEDVASFFAYTIL
ncbi:DUF3298 and DUF4163 domain-containing protein [Aquimarina sediminis]|uniref:DUF3298 and DUF4163 domain-containing protein n=1 Tax=Aquimarina sediminis TaxID=2070536 RepID=UPI000CA060D4|nr:DUF3298 and DUF4163 domain-containing protein [Aquimarina sediminis]